MLAAGDLIMDELAGSNTATISDSRAAAHSQPIPIAENNIPWPANAAQSPRRPASLAHQPVPRIRDLIWAILAAAANQKQKACRHGYILSLLNLLETVLYYQVGRLSEKPNRAGRKIDFDDFVKPSDGRMRLIDQPISVFNLLLAADYSDARLSTVQDPLREKSARQTLASETRQVRALFTSPWAQAAYARAGLLVAPHVDTFVKYTRTFHAPKQTPRMLEGAQIQHVHLIIRRLIQEKDPAVAMVLVLALLCGLRRGEIIHAKPTWLKKDVHGWYCLKVSIDADFSPKFSKERYIRIKKWLYQWLQKHAAGKFLVYDEPQTVWRILDRAYACLRQLGIDAPKPLHALRGAFAGYLMAEYSDQPAQIAPQMGHENLRTTMTYYATLPLPPHLAALWNRPLPGKPWGQQAYFDFAA